MTDPVLRVADLTLVRGGQTVLHRVCFSIQSGSHTAIVGPNGAGKSSLVQAILGILPRQSGQIELLGHPLGAKGQLDPAVRQAIAYLPQQFMVDRRIPMTVAELVGLGWDRLELAWPWRDARPRHRAIESALAQVEAIHLRRQGLSALSGGELKRVLLAYCLVRPRQLLILDEAPAGLDARGEADFYRCLYHLQQQHRWTILQISHDLSMVQRHCDHVLCLNRELLCAGTPDIALTPEALGRIYGDDFVRYHHTCRPRLPDSRIPQASNAQKSSNP
ncbi:metal ABC transporter ATP-binding protein [Lyngbya confervoides]|uniref:Metal ABC transporter ATP-binding protein n=1 Tax=Lyngbya confervoides BDU141951 TaxID=1574623 RepID=A0ABD4T3S4_9CYAN|nr:metal ABC transporter ATP-binding protein [Lyngbya confervoides]MCM1983219.1 metal ABC transporter ATP-binding protein [Lyngbya confervoides BDU141951]